MNLEDRIAHWIDLGVIPYQKAYVLQKKLAEKREKDIIPDTILFAEHPPIIDFGKSGKHNNFSPNLIEQFGNDDSIIEYLQQQGIGFSKTARGSGATYIGPGQLLVYPVVDYHKVIGELKDGMDNGLRLTAYRDMVDKIMYDTLISLGVNDARIVEVSKEMNEEEVKELRKDRKDIWITRNGQHYKLGGKGFHTSHNIAYHGFNLYLTEEGVNGFKYIEACGYPKSKLDVISVERASGIRHTIPRVRDEVLKNIKKHFNYSKIIPVGKEDING